MMKSSCVSEVSTGLYKKTTTEDRVYPGLQGGGSSWNRGFTATGPWGSPSLVSSLVKQVYGGGHNRLDVALSPVGDRLYSEHATQFCVFVFLGFYVLQASFKLTL